LRIDNVTFIICATVQQPVTRSGRCNPINPNRTAMFLLSPTAPLLACRPAARAAVTGLDAMGVFVQGAPPGAGVR
jgi:hypothetical protein